MIREQPIYAMMIGLPGTGKSTFAKTILERDSEVVYYSSDAMLEILCECNGLTYSEGFKQFIKQATENASKARDYGISQGYDIVDDHTNTHSNKRKVKLDLAKNYMKVAYVFKTPVLEEWKRRLDRPGKHIPQEVLDQMQRFYEPPTLNEGFNAIVDMDHPFIKEAFNYG